MDWKFLLMTTVKKNDKQLKTSGYTTSRNILKMDFPVWESLTSMSSIVDEVVVFDTSDGNDNTLEKLHSFSKENPKIKVFHEDWDWKTPNHGVLDGLSKASSRQRCSGEILVQFDLDEVVHESQVDLWKNYLKDFNDPTIFLAALPVVEWWGSDGKVRIDVNFWKWRVSKNHPNITHGVPHHLRTFDNSGLLYAKPGTDGCDYVTRNSGEIVTCFGFMSQQELILQNNAVYNEKALKLFSKVYKQKIEELPTIYHYSWFNIERKIKQYREFWSDFWPSLCNETRNTNPFFPDLSWEHVTDEMIIAKADALESLSCGHVFHKPWDSNSIQTLGITLGKEYHPKIMKDWIKL